MRPGRPFREHREDAADRGAHLPAVDNHIDRAHLKKELGALEAFRKILADGLLNHARTSKADQGTRLRDHDIAHKGERRGNTAHRRISEDRNEGKTGL